MKCDLRFREQLQEIQLANPHSLKGEVARIAMDSENIAIFFADLLQHGCQSGMVSELIYYYDTHNFYDLHYEEIEEIRYELEESLGEPLQIKGDLKNWFAWLAFEETAYKIKENFKVL